LNSTRLRKSKISPRNWLAAGSSMRWRARNLRIRARMVRSKTRIELKIVTGLSISASTAARWRPVRSATCLARLLSPDRRAATGRGRSGLELAGQERPRGAARHDARSGAAGVDAFARCGARPVGGNGGQQDALPVEPLATLLTGQKYPCFPTTGSNMLSGAPLYFQS